jgi:hypothetical protein
VDAIPVCQPTVKPGGDFYNPGAACTKRKEVELIKTLIIAIVVDVYYRRHCFFATGKSERFVSFIRRIKTVLY